MATLLVAHEASYYYHLAVIGALEQLRHTKNGVNQSILYIEFFQKSLSSISSSSSSYEK